MNESITCQRILLIDQTGKRLGVFFRNDALSRAREADLDLVQVGLSTDYAICKLIDYKKFLSDRKRKQVKTSPINTKMKEIKLSLFISSHDLGIKIKQIENLLTKGFKVKITLLLRGRQNIQKDKGIKLLQQTMERVAEFGVTKDLNELKKEGSLLSVVINSKGKNVQTKRT